jgi:hypothetical protein
MSDKTPTTKRKRPSRAKKAANPPVEPHECATLELLLGQLFDGSRRAARAGDAKAEARVDAIRALFALL